MYQSLDLFQTAVAMARHAGTRQAVVARNIANADTPGYRAQQIAPFGDVYGAAPMSQIRQSRPGHLAPDPRLRVTAAPVVGGTEASPNGNTVSLEDEMLASVAVSRDHNRALAVYRHGLTILRTALGRG